MSRPWSSVPSQNRGSPPATKLGGSSESERKLVAGLNGSVGAIHGANSAARKRTTVMTPAATVTFDDRKLARRSLSFKRAMKLRGGADSALGGAAISLISALRAMQMDPQPRVHGDVEEIDDEIDDHEQRRDQQEVGRHDRNVRVLNRLQEELAHAGPGEHRLGDNRESDDRAELQADDGNHRHQRISESVMEMHRSLGKPPGPREPDVVGSQDLEHLGAHQPHDQRHLEQRERDGGHDQGLQPGNREQAGRPPGADMHHLAPAERGQPAQPHREEIYQQDTDQERWKGYADQRQRLEQLGERAFA